MSGAQRKRIDKGLKDVVLKELAGIDNCGEFIVGKKFINNPIFDKYKFPKHTEGIWI